MNGIDQLWSIKVKIEAAHVSLYTERYRKLFSSSKPMSFIGGAAKDVLSTQGHSKVASLMDIATMGCPHISRWFLHLFTFQVPNCPRSTVFAAPPPFRCTCLGLPLYQVLRTPGRPTPIITLENNLGCVEGMGFGMTMFRVPSPVLAFFCYFHKYFQNLSDGVRPFLVTGRRLLRVITFIQLSAHGDEGGAARFACTAGAAKYKAETRKASDVSVDSSSANYHLGASCGVTL